jgi:uncharacterized membrane protein
MNQTHIHLLITHLPIFGSILGAIVLSYGLWTKSIETKIASYFLLIISSLGAATAYLTGEAAEESVENLPGVLETAIEAHEEFALFAIVSLSILGLAAVIGLFLAVKKSPLTRTFAFVILVVSLISFGLVARTGYLGGQIRHTEISSGAVAPAESGEEEED